MAVKIIAKKSKSAEAVVDSIVQPEVIDEYATLSAKLKKRQENLKPLTKQVGDLEKGIVGATDTVLEPDVKITLPGIDYELELGPQGQRIELVNPEKVFEILGFDLFMKLAKISAADLKSYLNPDQFAEVTVSKFAIKRRVKVVKL